MSESHVILSIKDYHTILHQSEQFKRAVNRDIEECKNIIGIRQTDGVFEIPQFVYIMNSDEVVEEAAKGVKNAEAVVDVYKARNKSLNNESHALKASIKELNNELDKRNQQLKDVFSDSVELAKIKTKLSGGFLKKFFYIDRKSVV